MVPEKLFYVGVKGLVKDKNGRFLLLLADVTKHRKNVEPYWDIPGGRIKEGGTVLEALEREILEETGIKASKPQFLTAVVSNHEIPIDDDKLGGLVLMIYTVSVPEDAKVVISEEHTDFEWVTKAEAKKRLQHKYPKEFTDAL
ncbi:MAG: NUDIX hydrolase [Candidatus Saccharimonadales bacterium]